jgi:hypothetical protein
MDSRFNLSTSDVGVDGVFATAELPLLGSHYLPLNGNVPVFEQFTSNEKLRTCSTEGFRAV